MVMACALHEELLQDENNAWAAFKDMKDSGSSDEEELDKRYRNACNASIALRTHLENCPDCKATGTRPTPVRN
jgi:hypothetical protein